MTQEQIEEYGRIVSDAKQALIVATENLHRAMIAYWYQETGVYKGEKLVLNGKTEVFFDRFVIEYGCVRPKFLKVKKDGTPSQVSEYAYITSVEQFKSKLTPIKP